MTDPIKKVCEAVGWEDNGNDSYLIDEYGDENSMIYMVPSHNRLHLHALVGTFEDLVREKSFGELTIYAEGNYCRVFGFSALDGEVAQGQIKKDDWLMAKLEALWQVWEKVK